MPKTPARRVMPFHPAANLFPMMSAREFEDLKEDIRANGLREPIWTHEGAILDGRNRYNACLRLEEEGEPIEPEFREWDGEGSVVAFVVSLNLHRRHLNESQRAWIAADLATMKSGTRTDLASIEARSQAEAAELLNTSRSNLQRAAKVKRSGDPELAAAVQQGSISVSAAVNAIDIADRLTDEHPEIIEVIPEPATRRIIAGNINALPTAEKQEMVRKIIAKDEVVTASLSARMPSRKPAQPTYARLYEAITQVCKLSANLNADGGVLAVMRDEEWTARDIESFVGNVNRGAVALTALYNELSQENVLYGETTADFQYIQ